MNEIQPWVNIQVNGADFGLEGSVGNYPIQAQSQSVSLQNAAMLSALCNGANASGCGNSSQDYQAVTNQFVAAIDQIIRTFRSLIEGLLAKLQVPPNPAANGTGSGTVPAAGSAPSSTGSPASTASSSSSGAVGPSTGASSGTTSTTGGASASPSSGSSSNPTPQPASSTPPPAAPSTTSSSGTQSNGTTSSSAKPLGKTGQFLWKPKADKDGRLVILLPKKLGRVKSVRILSADGKTTLATGRYSGFGNGDRAHYRFSKAGTEFPKGAVVEIAPQRGAPMRVTIPDPAKRFTH